MTIASRIIIVIMSTWKLIQRRCYDLLSHKSSLLIVLVAFTCIFVGIIHFGEVSRQICTQYLSTLFNLVFQSPLQGSNHCYCFDYFDFLKKILLTGVSCFCSHLISGRIAKMSIWKSFDIVIIWNDVFMQNQKLPRIFTVDYFIIFV